MRPISLADPSKVSSISRKSEKPMLPQLKKRRLKGEKKGGAETRTNEIVQEEDGLD